jgi:carbon storage regulator
MLVLSRKIGEQIVLGDGIVITVAAISGLRVRLGITAPPHVSIRREELDARADPGSPALPAARTPGPPSC